MTDVQPERDQEPDPSVTTPQPDENPQQREKLNDAARTAPGRGDPEDDQERGASTPPIANPD